MRVVLTGTGRGCVDQAGLSAPAAVELIVHHVESFIGEVTPVELDRIRRTVNNASSLGQMTYLRAHPARAALLTAVVYEDDAPVVELPPDPGGQDGGLAEPAADTSTAWWWPDSLLDLAARFGHKPGVVVHLNAARDHLTVGSVDRLVTVEVDGVDVTMWAVLYDRGDTAKVSGPAAYSAAMWFMDMPGAGQ